MRPFTVFLFLSLAGGLGAQSPGPSLHNLVSNSPFGTAAQANVSTATGATLEFRGTFVDGGERFFSLVDTATRRSEWVSLNEADRPFVVRSFDPDSETITVDHQGRTLNLKLHAARVGVLPQQPVAQAGPPQPGTTGQPAANQPSATEAQRLAQVAEEIRRRRALRQQSTNPQNAQPPQPTPQNQR